jgi:hypothetical protein
LIALSQDKEQRTCFITAPANTQKYFFGFFSPVADPDPLIHHML